MHFVVPGGGISPDGSEWLQAKQDKLFHPLPAKRLYKQLFVEAIRKAGLYDQLPPGVLKFDWVVNIRPVGNGEAVLKYLAPYVYRIAICDNRILSVDDQEVKYLVKPSGKHFYVTRRLDGESFVQAFAQHILPPGFRKLRYYGFMSANSKLQLADARWLVWMWLGWCYNLAVQTAPPPLVKRQPPPCEHCGGEVALLAITNGLGEWLWQCPNVTRGPPHTPVPASQREATRA